MSQRGKQFLRAKVRQSTGLRFMTDPKHGGTMASLIHLGYAEKEIVVITDKDGNEIQKRWTGQYVVTPKGLDWLGYTPFQRNRMMNNANI